MKTIINYSAFVLLMVLISASALYAQLPGLCVYPQVVESRSTSRDCLTPVPGKPCPEGVNRSGTIYWDIVPYKPTPYSMFLVGSVEQYQEASGGCSMIPRWKECPYYIEPTQTREAWVRVLGWDSSATQTLRRFCYALGPPVLYFGGVLCDKAEDHSFADARACSQCVEDYDCPYDPGTVYRCSLGQCQPVGGTPIIVSEHGNQLQLTDRPGGVHFDLNADGTAELISWTAPGSDDAFLAMDRNGNGTIDNGGELFGSYTPQPPAPEKNGFLALAMLDRPEYGGNGDGLISAADQAYGMLVMWTDANHDGTSQSEELRRLSGFGITAISLDYRLSPRVDKYGNRFRYISRVDVVHGNRHAVDVFLLTTP